MDTYLGQLPTQVRGLQSRTVGRAVGHRTERKLGPTPGPCPHPVLLGILVFEVRIHRAVGDLELLGGRRLRGARARRGGAPGVGARRLVPSRLNAGQHLGAFAHAKRWVHGRQDGVEAAHTRERLGILVERRRPQRRRRAVRRIGARRSVQPKHLVHVDGRTVELARRGAEAQHTRGVDEERVALTEAQDRHVGLGEQGGQCRRKPFTHGFDWRTSE